MTTKRPLNFRQLVRYAVQGTALGLVIATIVLLLTVNRDTVRELRSVPWQYLPLLFGLVGCAWISAGSRIWLLARCLGYRLGFRRSLAIAVASEFGVAASPAGMGGTVVRLTLMRRAGIPLISGT
ncbi:MAG: flippase-like domain-containing protein, partial [Lentisphaerae bacterium]|nr:flippase-like domain-containing protein [Lentisphaerota bacterium]